MTGRFEPAKNQVTWQLDCDTGLPACQINPLKSLLLSLVCDSPQHIFTLPRLENGCSLRHVVSDHFASCIALLGRWGDDSRGIDVVLPH
jgi:hypothetical protein